MEQAQSSGNTMKILTIRRMMSGYLMILRLGALPLPFGLSGGVGEPPLPTDLSVGPAGGVSGASG